MQPRKHLNEAVSAVIRLHRSTLGLSQEKLSLMADLDRTFVSKLERGTRNPTIESIFRLAEALGMLPEKLLQEIREEYERLREVGD